MNTSSSLEALAFQKSSQLGLALEKAFQKAIDYRDSVPFELQKDSIHKYCRSTLRQDILNAFKSTVNLEMENVVFIHRWPSCDFAISLYTTARNGSVIVTDRNYGLNKITNPNKEIEELLELYKSVNTSNGKFSLESDITNPILYFDISFGLLLHHYVPIDIVEPLTAKELAAIYLHECGHFFSLLDRTRYNFFVYERMHTQLSKLIDKYNLSEIVTAINDKKEDIKKIISSLDSNSKDLLNKLDIVSKTANTINLFYSRIDNEDREQDKDKLYITTALLTKSLIFIVKDILGKLLLRPFLNILDEYKDSKVLLERNNSKTSDQISTNKQVTMCEQDADEYTVRSGYSQYQISSLGKMKKAFTYINAATNIKGFDYNLNKLNKDVLDIVRSLLPFYKDSYYIQYCDLYESGIDRLKRLCQMGIAGLKNTNPEIQLKYISQYENCIKELSEIEKFAKSDITVINKFINSIVNSPSVFIDNLLTGRINKDYFTLQNQVEELINNKLYFYGNKFKSYLK